MNLRQLSPSRKRIRAGDIFVYQLKREPHLLRFGRVIKVNVPILGMRALLVYLYRATSESKHTIPHLRCDDLLTPPIITSSLLWRWGYFENVLHAPLEPNDFLERHCFRWAMRDDMLVDAEGRSVTQRSEPCGDFALTLPMGMDDRISDAVGIPKVKHGELDPKTGREL